MKKVWLLDFVLTSGKIMEGTVKDGSEYASCRMTVTDRAEEHAFYSKNWASTKKEAIQKAQQMLEQARSDARTGLEQFVGQILMYSGFLKALTGKLSL